MSNPVNDEVKPAIVKRNKGKQNHEEGIWLNLKRFDAIVKYVQFIALIAAFVMDRLNNDGYEKKYLWWITGGTLALNFLMMCSHLFLYYVVNRWAEDKYYWPKVFPKRWQENKPSTGYFYHYWFFFVLKVLVLAYVWLMILKEKLDNYYVYPVLFLSELLIIFDLCYYLFSLR